VAKAGWLLAVAGAALLPALTTNTYYLYLGCTIGLLTIVAAGLNILSGFTGQISLGHAGFYALGAYAAALGATRLGWPAWAAAGAGVALAAAVGALVAAAALRVTGPYLAMVTIAFGIIVEGILVQWVPVTGGPAGIFNIPKPPLARYYLLISSAAGVSLWLLGNIRRSPWGRAFLAVKSSELAAESVGLSTYYVRIVAFTLSASFAGGAGALFAFLNGYISPDSFTLQTSILFLLALLWGGLGSIAGPLIGSLTLTLLPELLTGLAEYRLIFYGALLLVSIYWLPAGVVGLLAELRSRYGQHGAEAARSRSSPIDARAGEETGGSLPPGTVAGDSPRDARAREAANRPATDPLLSVDGIGLSFGGVAALTDVTLAVDRGTIHAIIGPNGAGKTSLLNVLTAYYAPNTGTITLARRSLAGLAPHRVARLGVARTFQTAQLFDDLSVRENVAVGLARAGLGSILAALIGAPPARRRERSLMRAADRLLESLGLAALGDEPAASLAAGPRRRIEIARALAQRPALLMLDEPAAGLTSAEIAELDAELERLRREDGPAVILVEHHMDLVMTVADRITVLDQGRVIATGAPRAVREDPAVVEAYLGAAP
jgi:ABC-type branched-subunit amino acid transport system ATPase component/ABC-type branched-subunit amino acid transport system permease subunit